VGRRYPETVAAATMPPELRRRSEVTVTMTTIAPRPAIFVDRDNTLIDDPGYLCDPEEVRLQPGAAQAVANLRAAGYPVVVVTNQSGIARGLLTEAQLAEIHQRMQDLLHAQGTGVDAIYYCPYLDGPEAVVEEYHRESDLRKPAPGMLLRAASDLHLAPASSWMVGDSERDMQAGKSAGCRTILLVPEGLRSEIPADFVATDLAAASEIVLAHRPAPVTAEAPSAMANQPPAPPAAARQQAEQSNQTEAHAVALAPTSAAGSATPVSASAAEKAAVATGSQQHTGMAMPPATASSEEVARQILDELRSIRRQQQHRDFSIAKLAAAIVQAFAICAIAWGLYCWMSVASARDPSATAFNAYLSLLVGIAFQLMALTFFAIADRK
jgi:D-glycero-D-manno-heptose 1,7-bisphosphate phosphatase